MQTHTIHTFRINELDKAAQSKAIDRCFYINVEDDDWSDPVVEDAKRLGEVLGIKISDVFYTGFSRQGDGAQFQGEYGYQPGCVENIRSTAPLEKELHSIAMDLVELQKPWFYSLRATVCSNGSYRHEYCTKIEVTANEDIVGFERALSDAQEGMQELLRRYMRWIYIKLEAEFDHLTDSDQVRQAMIIQEKEFLEDGSPY